MAAESGHALEARRQGFRFRIAPRRMPAVPNLRAAARAADIEQQLV